MSTRWYGQEPHLDPKEVADFLSVWEAPMAPSPAGEFPVYITGRPGNSAAVRFRARFAAVLEESIAEPDHELQARLRALRWSEVFPGLVPGRVWTRPRRRPPPPRPRPSPEPAQEPISSDAFFAYLAMVERTETA